MLGMASYSTSEPIYALATPYSPSALAVIRASGDGVIALLQSCFEGNLRATGRTSIHHGYIKRADGSRIDEVMAIVYPKGHGYTSEEAFEVITHGSLPVIRAISRLFDSLGIREALKGEFTYRAFMHGRLDLTEAEAVEEIVKSRSERGSSDALLRLSGSILAEAEKAKDEILSVLASLEVQLDYGEDEIPEDWEFPGEKLRNLRERLLSIASTFNASKLWSEGASVVIAGRTNAGKSSLYNALLKENRAIVSPEEGTTRDYIEADITIKGIPVHLYDTAGLRSSDDTIEQEGIRRAEALMENASLIVYVIDPSSDDVPPQGDRILPVSSHLDVVGTDYLSFSSVTGEGIGDVVDAIAERLEISNSEAADVPRIDSERQKAKLEEAAAALADAEANQHFGYDIIALYLQSALTALGELTGSVTEDDVLERIFSSFCLGK